MKNRLKFLKSLLVALLVISVSTSTMVLSGFSDSSLEVENTSGVFIEDADAESNTEQSISSDLIENRPNAKSDQEIITEELEVKRIKSSEIISKLGLSTEYKDLIPSIENRLSYNPMTVKHNNNPLEMAMAPDTAFYSSTSDSESNAPITGYRGGRADAGDDSAHATLIKEGGNWTGDDLYTTYDSNNQRYTIQDQDWFYITVEEKGNLETEYVKIYINNSAKSHANDPRDLYCFLYDPVSVILSQNTYNIPGDLFGKNLVSDDDTELSQSFLDFEIFNPQENGTLNAAPPISGIFFIQLYCISRDYYLPYNITAITKTVIKPVANPYDKNNYPDNATVPQSKNTITGSIFQHKDHWDWYDISDFVEFHGVTWPNEISFDVDITSSATVPNSYYSWTEVWVMYDNTDGSTLFLNGDMFETGGSPSITVGGSPSTPIKNDFEMTGSNAWIGLRVYSVGINSQGNLFNQRYDGSVDYSLTFDVELQNNNPLLFQGKIEPPQEYYFMDDEITFSVRYRDLDNNPPSYVRVTIDGINYDMSGSGSNYQTGVLYQLSVVGSDLNDNFYPHTFNFSSSDGLVPITMSLSSPNNEFKVIEDQTPLVWPDAPKSIKLDEDDDDYLLPLSQIFQDVDPPDGLKYTIKKEAKYGQKFESSRLEVLVFEQKKLKFILKDDQWGDDDFVVRAEEELKRDTDVYNFYASYKVNVSISSIQDNPMLQPIGKIHGYQDELIYFQIQATDADILTDDDSLTFTTNRSDGVGPDDLDTFKVIPDTIDETRANISFTPANMHVGSFIVKVTVEDEEGLEDTRDVEFEIVNVNDPPTITKIKKGDFIKDTTDLKKIEMFADEDEWFNISVEIEDIDVAIGVKNEILFKIQNQTFINNVVLDHKGSTSLTANIGVLPLNADVGVKYINFSVHDGKGGTDSISIKVNVENVNDPPTIPTIIRPKTTTFSLIDEIVFEGVCDDDDLKIKSIEEKLLYTWYIKDKSFRKLAEPGNYTIKLEVIDNEGELQFIELVILLVEDFDNDNIPDEWEVANGLDHRDREDAFEDSDKDGFSNIDEYEAKTDPRDQNDKPADLGSKSEENVWIIPIILIVIVVIVLLVLFLVFKNKQKAKEEMDDIENLAYPAEEEPAPQFGLSQSTTTPGSPSPGGPGPMPPFPPPPPGVPPAVFHMQYMKMMQQLQQQQQQKAGPTGSGVGGVKPQTQGLPISPTTKPIDKDHELGGISLTPKLPPGSKSSSGMDNSLKKDEDMKCPNCGISVQSGWFLCPGCKSPLN
jgi:hypothetical protein